MTLVIDSYKVEIYPNYTKVIINFILNKFVN